ncbi:MAG: hypothetical protein LBC05_00255 [Endomicrobium sp.]|jgi:Holliday junction DNA helicase RuvA|nr:hypothetical protein [Endomicrobium sp.]
MIDCLYGILDSKSSDSTMSITVKVDGVGYAVFISAFTFEKLPEIGDFIKIYVVETVTGMYNCIICLYGFISKDERDVYLLIKNEVPSIGAKKALEYTNKIFRSFTNFKAAIISKDLSVLNKIFGFTKKTSDKLIMTLKEKISNVYITTDEKKYSDVVIKNTLMADAIECIVALGYKKQQAITVVTNVYNINNNITLENLVKKSLQYL